MNAYAASVACTTWIFHGSANMATSGCTSVTFPPTMRKPVGICIHALASVTNAADAAPDTITGISASQCCSGVRRSRPYR